MGTGIFIDLHVSDSVSELVAGYRKIKTARLFLLGKWRFKLLRAYAKRRDRHFLKMAQFRSRQAQIKRVVPWIGLAGLLLFSLGLILAANTYGILGSLCVLASLAGCLLTLFGWFVLSLPPGLPEHPVRQLTRAKQTSPVKQNLFPDLLSKWELGMLGRIPAELEVAQMAEQEKMYGLIGEYNLIRALDRVVSPETIILHSVMPKKNDDLDVVLIGPKGIWYFEVKYKNAHFDWHAGVWAIGMIDHNTRQFKFDDKKEHPDEQWRRMLNEASKNLNAALGELISKYPNIGRISGGVVFSHPKATFDIQRPASFAWGNIQDWVLAYQKAPLVKEMTPTVILKLTEVFLKPHQVLNPAQRVLSMKNYATQIIQAQERVIQKWIDAS